MNIKMLKAAFAGLVLFVSGFANAGLIIGDTNAGGNWFPFGGGDSSENWGPTYQMVFDSNLFNSNITIDTLRFYVTSGSLAGDGQYTISLSTTNASSTTLLNNAASNFGGDNTVVFAGLLGSLNGSFLDIDLSSDFFYDLNVGNLLMTVSNIGGTTDGVTGFASNDGGDVARLFRDQVSSNGWLTTGFNQFQGANAVPEPTTLAIFALGLMGLASRRFKKQ